MRAALAPLSAFLVAFSWTPIGNAGELKPVGSANPQSSRSMGMDWPCFLGPSGTGVTTDAGLADHWPESGPPVVWGKRIGTGYSAPSVRRNRLVVHHRPRRELIECLRADNGEPIWKYEYESGFAPNIESNDGPRCTPLLTENRCYAFGPSGKLLCLDLATGKEIWSRSTLEEFTVPALPFGIGPTPILEGDLLIVLVGGQPNSGAVAFHKETGKTVWTSVGKETWDEAKTTWRGMPIYHWTGKESFVSYSSPVAATIHGKRHILCLLRHGLVSLDPQDGHVRFKYWFAARTADSVAAARPVVSGDAIFLTTAYGTGCVLLQVEPSGEEVKPVWINRRGMQAHWSTPIAVGDFLYGFSGRYEQQGELVCLNLKTGRIPWRNSGLHGHIDDFAIDERTGEIKERNTGKVVPPPRFGRGSLTQVGNRFLVLGERGTLALADLDSKGYHERCRTSFRSITFPVWASPVVAGTRLYLRDEDTLLCVELGRQPAVSH